MEPLIRTHDLSYAYLDSGGKAIPALKGVQTTIAEGEWVAVVGANGSGKSTLARHLNGLLLPTQGEVYVKGIRTDNLASRNELRRTISMVFQHPESQAVATTVEEDVAFGPENLGIPSAEIRRRVDWALDVVGLAGMQKRAPHHLSGGQKQRLALAGVLAMQPRCIVLDEATSMLDPAGRRSFREIIQQLHAQGVTIVMITQDMDEAVLSDRVMVLSQGQIVRDGAPRDVMVDGQFLERVGLDLPSMARLGQLLHTYWPDFPGNLLTVNEIVQQVSLLLHARYPRSHGAEKMKLFSPNGSSKDASDQTSIRDLAQDDQNFIEARDLWHTYLRGSPLETNALHGVDFHVRIGEIIGIIGATGSGKSTLLQHLNGLLTLQAGTLRVGTQWISSRSNSLRTLRQQVALLFQQPEDQLFERYVADDVAYGPLNLKLSLEEVRQRVGGAMQAVGLPLEVYRDRSIYSLSGGERRRAALAGVLALEPKILVLDEATAGLDPRGRRELTALLRSWQANGDRSIVWASHSMDEIAQMAKRITVLDSGRVVLEGSPRQVFHETEALTSYGLDVPQIVQVLNGLAQMGYPVNQALFNVDETASLLKSMIG